ncbi:unnamed protein product [Linum tenue]|nr:unnamed protein product [Linum tenue]
MEKIRYRRKWRSALIVKVLGRTFPYPILAKRLESMWAKFGSLQINSISWGFYVVRFTNQMDYERAAAGGPWMIGDHSITVRPWRKGFDPKDAEVATTMVWAKLLGLPIEYVNKEAAERIASRMGKPVRVDRMGIPQTQDLGRYLGVPVLHGRVTKQTYKYILDRLDNKLAGWKATSLSFAGRVTLARSVLSSLPTYAMQTTLLPISICDEIVRRVRKFIWGSTGDSRKIHLVHWEGVCQTKKEGGLGFRKAHELNLAFLAKLVWLFTKKPDELWVYVLQSKYFKTVNGVLVAKSSARSSNLWRGMRKAWPVTNLVTLMHLKDGMSTSLWTDQWVEMGVVLMDYLKEDSPPIDPCTHVAAFVDNGKWDLNTLSQFLLDELLLKIAGVQPPVEGAGEDVPTWGPEVNGTFSVRTAYSLATDCSDKDDAAKWKEIWKWRGPERVRHFLWLAMRERLLTNSERARRKLTTSTGCGACGCAEETVLHVLRDCDLARLTWMQLIPPSEGLDRAQPPK